MNRFLLVLITFGVFFFSSCLMKKIEYVKDMSTDSIYNIKASRIMKIQVEDRLSILVESENADLAIPFNRLVGGTTLLSDTKLVGEVNDNDNFEGGYLVDKDGFIEFPIFGKIKVEGLSTEEIEILIENLLAESNYIKKSEVKVKLLNFKIMMMGNVSNTILNVPEGKITILEAIVRNGGLNLTSDAKNVMVIREENGERRLLTVNMEKYDMFNSDVYNLQQNDIVYIKPKYGQLSPGFQNVWQVVGVIMGATSLILTSIVLFRSDR